MKLETKVLNLLEGNTPVVLITVIDKQGSGPRSPGAKIVLTEDGTFWGTIGGGEVENKAIAFARAFFDGESEAAVEHYQLQPGHEGENIDMLCGGRVSLLFERFSPDSQNKDLFRCFDELVTASKKGVWAINLDATNGGQDTVRNLLTHDGNAPQDLVSLKKYLVTDGKATRTSHLLEFEGTRWFVDSFSGQSHLVIVGGGHIALEVAILARSVDFDVCICDNRPEFANEERFPMVNSVAVIEEYIRIFEQVPVGKNTFILILTHSHAYDQSALEQALQTDACYVGMIGSLRKRDAIYANLRDGGVSDDRLRSVYSPVGLDIAAESPVEIAISIVAELIKVRAQ